MTSFAVVLMAVATSWAGDEPPPASPKARYEALVKDFAAAEARWDRKFLGDDPAKADWAKVDTIARYREWPMWDFLPRFLAIADDAPADPTAVDALLWVVGQARAIGTRDRGYLPHFERAIERLATLHRSDPRFRAAIAENRNHGLSPACERMLRDAADDRDDRELRGVASVALGLTLMTKAEIAPDPWFARKPSNAFEGFLAARVDPAFARYLKECDPAATRDEAERRLRAAADGYGDVEVRAASGRTYSVGKLAAAALKALRQPEVGRVAPEVQGVDADGSRFALSHSRGKVVVLTFSGDWCGPCKAMYPQERELVQRMKGRPFALLSVNTDADRETLRKALTGGEITWRCWWDGGTEGPICDAWGVQSFPTVFVLDKAGVIRFKNVRDKELIESVETLLKAGE